MQRFSASVAATSTQKKCCAFGADVASVLLKQCLICIQIVCLVSSRVSEKAEKVKRKASSAVASVHAYA